MNYYWFKIHQTGMASAYFGSNGMRSLSHRFPMLDDIKDFGVAKVFGTRAVFKDKSQ